MPSAVKHLTRESIFLLHFTTEETYMIKQVSFAKVTQLRRDRARILLIYTSSAKISLSYYTS